MAASSPADRPRGLSGLLGRAGRWLRRLVRASTPEPSPRPRPGIGIDRLPIRPSRLMIGYYLQHLRHSRRRQLVTTAQTVAPSGESLGPAGRPSHQELALQHRRRRPRLLSGRRSAITDQPIHPYAHSDGHRNAHRDGQRSAHEDAERPAHDDGQRNAQNDGARSAREDGAQAMAGAPIGSYSAPGPLGWLAARARSERATRRLGSRASLTGRGGAATVGLDSTVRARGYAAPAVDHHRPEQAWRASVAADPLETPAALPARWTPLVHAITGRSHARFTTGAATRRALTSAGAHGATSGTTLHLPRTPIAADLPVVAHELAHSRMALARPRFLLGHDHAGDADERAAHTVAGAAMNAVRPATAPDVSRLPVTGLGGLPQAVSTLMDRAAQVGPRGRSTQPSAAGTAQTAFDQLGAGGRDVGPATDVSGTSGSAGQTATNGQDGSAGGGATMTTGTVSAGTAAGSAAGSAAGGGAAAPGLDLDQLIESLETRLIRELERRGGRFADVF